ncbi:hypothetical protein ZWY2020_047071 [Hordeum vulgare]|nr:hypothetical protein ZWY2020_047071 [Hordeum vulgare]
MLLEVPEAERADAASSLVYEANLRLRDPVYGCMGAISMLQQQVNALEAELEAVRAEIFKHRYRQAGVVVGVGAANLIVDDGAAARRLHASFHDAGAHRRRGFRGGGRTRSGHTTGDAHGHGVRCRTAVEC